MLDSNAIVCLQDDLTVRWHADPEVESPQDYWPRLIARQHRANFDLWHIEDEARRRGATDSEIAGVKRRIDSTNQVRNDLVEEMDRALLATLKQSELPNPAAALHSETPGLIIDRLSILSLKIFHTAEEAGRIDGPEGHCERNHERLMVLKQQRTDLAGCLDALWREICEGKRGFKLYRQLKMYNDPTLNPSIYRGSDKSDSHKD